MWSFPDFSREAPILRPGVGTPTPGRPACLAHPSSSWSIPERPPQPLLAAWPRALRGGMQLLSDIPAAAQTQWHFVKSWATPSPLSVCWRCRGNQIPCLYVPPLPALLQSAPSPTPLSWPPRISPSLPRDIEATEGGSKHLPLSGTRERLFGRRGCLKCVRTTFSVRARPRCGHSRSVGVAEFHPCAGRVCLSM